MSFDFQKILVKIGKNTSFFLADWGQGQCGLFNIIVIFILASLTWKYQLVDVCFAGTFKNYYTQFWTNWFVKQLEKAYNGEEGAYRKKSLNYIRPSMVKCVLWANTAFEKMRTKKAMLKRKAKELYMAGEDEEMAALMPDDSTTQENSSHRTSLLRGLRIESL